MGRRRRARTLNSQKITMARRTTATIPTMRYRVPPCDGDVREAAGLAGEIPLPTREESSRVNVPTALICRPKLRAVSPVGAAGVVQVARVHPDDAGKCGLAVQ